MGHPAGGVGLRNRLARGTIGGGSFSFEALLNRKDSPIAEALAEYGALLTTGGVEERARLVVRVERPDHPMQGRDAGDVRHRSIDVLADGANSEIKLASLTKFEDLYAGSTTNENRFSSLTAKNERWGFRGLAVLVWGASATCPAWPTLICRSRLTLSPLGGGHGLACSGNADCL